MRSRKGKTVNRISNNTNLNDHAIAGTEDRIAHLKTHMGIHNTPTHNVKMQNKIEVQEYILSVLREDGGNDRRPPAHRYTVEELIKLGGKPVYFEEVPSNNDLCYKGWVVITEHNNLYVEIKWFREDRDTPYTQLIKNYGKTWLAYDRPPEEENDETNPR